jgi:adenosylcobinamide-phosphate synthase
MTFLSILCALLIEQLKPLRADNLIYAEIKALRDAHGRLVQRRRRQQRPHGLVPDDGRADGPTAVIYWGLLTYNGLFAAFAWNVLIVYLTLGFRHYSHYFTSIQMALNAGDEPPRAPAGRMDPARHGRHGSPPRSPASPSKNRW